MLAMLANLHDIVRYAASAGFNFPYRDGRHLAESKRVNLSPQAMLYSRSLDWEWALRDGSTRLGEVVEHSHRLQLVNTKLKNLAVAVVAQFPRERSEHFIFGERGSR